MEELKIDLRRIKQIFNAYACMFLINTVYMGVIVGCPAFLITWAIMQLPIANAFVICLLIWLGASALYMVYKYFSTCKKCIDKKVANACEECKCMKLRLCNNKIAQCKKSNHQEAISQMERIEKELAKLNNMKKDKHIKTLIEHLNEEYNRWNEIYEKNKKQN